MKSQNFKPIDFLWAALFFDAGLLCQTGVRIENRE